MRRPADLVRRGADYLGRHGVAAPEANAEGLLRSVLRVDRATLYTQREPVSPAQARAYGRALCLRCTGTPLQHLTGEQAFRRLVLRVRPGVFVPRPETEVLVDVALDRIEGVVGPVVADACTGTGAVALALADERPDAAVLATDLSPAAVALARENAIHLGLRCTVTEGDLLESVAGPVDLVTCNPPYVPVEAADDLPPEVRADPDLAVFGTPAIVERLFAQAATRLRPGGSVVVEIEESTGEHVCSLASAAGLEEATVYPDLNGRDRVVAARRPG